MPEYRVALPQRSQSGGSTALMGHLSAATVGAIGRWTSEYLGHRRDTR